MKIKILVECDPQSLEKICNEFIANKHVINIQFKINNYPDYFAFVTYEDKQHVRLDFCSSILSSARNIDFSDWSDISMIFEIDSVKSPFYEEGDLSRHYLSKIAEAGFNLMKAKDEFGDSIYKINLKNLSDLQLLHKTVNHDLIISFPESKPVPENTMSILCDSDDEPQLLIYDFWIE